MNIFLISLVLNCSLGMAALSLALLLVFLALKEFRKVTYLVVVDGIEVMARYSQARLDTETKRLAIEFEQRGQEIKLDHQRQLLALETERRLALMAAMDEVIE